MKQVTPGIGDTFGLVEQVLQETFVPALFQGLVEGIPGIGVTRLPVKQAGMSLPDPTKTAAENWAASCVIIGHLVAALRGQEEFRAADHSAYLQEGRMAVRKRGVLMVEEALAKTLARAQSKAHVDCKGQKRQRCG